MTYGFICDDLYDIWVIKTGARCCICALCLRVPILFDSYDFMTVPTYADLHLFEPALVRLENGAPVLQTLRWRVRSRPLRIFVATIIRHVCGLHIQHAYHLGYTRRDDYVRFKSISITMIKLKELRKGPFHVTNDEEPVFPHKNWTIQIQ